MRTYLVAALLIAVVACLACGVSANGYGGYGGKAVYQQYRPPVYGYRYFRQPYKVGGPQRYISGYNSGYYGGSSYGASGYFGSSGGSGFNIIWIFVILVIVFAILADN